MNIYAGAVLDYCWNFVEFTPGEGRGHCFQIRTLSYWQTQEIMALDSDSDKVRRCLELGLVSIDGDTDAVASFIANPTPKVVNPLFNLIWSASMGN